MSRRDLIRKVSGAAAAGSIGMAGVASADSGRADPWNVRLVLARNKDILEELHRNGVLDNPGLGQFDLETYAPPGAEQEGVSLSRSRNRAGETVPMYTINHETEDGFVHVRIRLADDGEDFASATHRTASDETVYGAVAPENDDGPNTQCHGGCGRCYVQRCNPPCFADDDCEPLDCCWCDVECQSRCAC